MIDISKCERLPQLRIKVEFIIGQNSRLPKAAYERMATQTN